MDELEQSAELPNSDAAHTAAAEDHEQQADQHEQQSDDAASQEQAEEEDEIEVDGKKFVMPKSAAEKLKAERLMHADYTRKTQETAERNRSLDAREQSITLQAAQQQQYLDDMAEMRAIDKQLKQYADLNWTQLIEQDPVQAMQLREQRDALKEQRNQAAQAVTTKQNDYALQEQQATAKQLQEAEAYVAREIPGWTNERGAAVNAFAAAEGMKLDQALAKLVIQQPALLKIFDKAEKFDQLVKKQSAKPSTPAAPPAPVTRVSAARASAKVDPAKLPVNDWMAQRNRQVRGR